MIGVTKAQKRVMDCIVAWLAEHGRPPTVREIGSVVGIRTPNGVMCHLKGLEKKGLISVERGVARGVRVLGVCPLCGSKHEEKVA